MKDLLLYVLWLQVFANMASVYFTYKIGRMKIAPSFQWFTFSGSLFFALIYRLIKLSLVSEYFAFLKPYYKQIVIIGDMIVLPLVAILIMIFTIQIYKILKQKNGL